MSIDNIAEGATISTLDLSVTTKKFKPASPIEWGGKGAHILDMVQFGLPVPPAVIIGTGHCMMYLNQDEAGRKEYMEETMMELVIPQIRKIKEEFGYMPLLSVRSGARVSMPGMMDTILNVGLNKTNMDAWVDRLGKRAAYDCFRRLHEMYGQTVLGLSDELFEAKQVDLCNHAAGVYSVADFPEKLLGDLIVEYRKFMKDENQLPYDVATQIANCIDAVWRSWNSDRAKHYRKMYGYSDDWGTAVTIQAMVFGNRDENSCSGVVFSRDPSTGENKMVGEYLANAQGEDVVAGTFTPAPVNPDNPFEDGLNDWNPEVYAQLEDIVVDLEKHYKAPQDIEFTVESNKLWILQTRNMKCGAKAAIVIAGDMVKYGEITLEEACKRITVDQYKTCAQDSIDPDFHEMPNTIGISGSQGVVSGIVKYTKVGAINCTEPFIYVAKDTTPDDIEIMEKSVGILTKNGGSTCHAAVVGRSLGKVCVVGCTDLEFSMDSGITLKGVKFHEGDKITIDGTTGKVWVKTEVPIVPGTVPEQLDYLVMKYLEQDPSTFLVFTEDMLKGDNKPYKNLYVSSAMLGGLTKEVLANLSGANAGDQLILDLVPLDDQVPEDDEILFKAFDDKKLEKSKRNWFDIDFELLRFKYNQKSFKLTGWKKPIMLRLPKWADESKVSLLKSVGFHILGEADSLDELLSPVGSDNKMALAPSKKLIDSIGDSNMIKIVALMEQSGCSFVDLPQVAHRETLVYEIFSKCG